MHLNSGWCLAFVVQGAPGPEPGVALNCVELN